MKDSATRLRTSLCPKCGYAIDAASPMPGERAARPSPRDFSLCINCGELLQFTESLGVEPANATDLDEFRVQNPDGYRMLQRGRALVIARGATPGATERGGRA